MVVQISLTLVSTVTVGSGGAASIEFTGIAGTGKDLLLLVSLRTTSSGPTHDLELNGTSITNNGIRLLGDSNGAQSYSGSYIPVNASTFTSNTFSNSAIYVSNYTSSANKSVSIDAVSENNAASTDQRGIMASIFNSSAAVTSMKVLPFSGASFVQYSTASLYIIS